MQRREPNDESKPKQLLIGMIFTNADPRYAGRLDDKQGGHTIVTMERVREAITFNAELADELTWLWLTSEQMGFPLRPTAHLAGAKRATVSVGKHLGDRRSETPAEKSLRNVWWETSYRLLLRKFRQKTKRVPVEVHLLSPRRRHVRL